METETTAGKRPVKPLLLFILCSLAGIFLFLIPLPIGGTSDLLIAVIADAVTAFMSPVLPYLLAGFFLLSAVISVIHKLHPIAFLNESPLLRDSFNLTPGKLAVQIIGAVLFSLCAFNIGPEFLISAATGGTMYSLMLSLAIWHLMSFYLFSLLMDFGTMDFVGTLIQRIMRPIFTLPGNAAVDCMASWVGNGPFGVIITKLQYQEGYYTKRESAVVATCFSIVSVSFCVIVAKTLDIMEYFGLWYLSITIATVLCAVILPRMWPLKGIANTYKPDAPKRSDVDTGKGVLRRAVDCGTQKAAEADLRHIIRRSNQTALDFFITVFPVMMAYGTILLVVVEYTPVMQYLAIPFRYLLGLLQVPEAAAAAPTMLVGFIDMYLPAVLGSTLESPVTRFIVGSVSIGQLIYMTETGSIIIKNRDIFDLSVWKLIVIFLLRTILSLLVAVGIAALVF